jgi:hypothetical protein
LDTRDGIEIKPLTVSPKDMKYNEGFEQMRDAILAIHKVPPLAAGIEQASGQDGLYAPLEQFVTLVVQPGLDLIAEEDNASWVWQFGKGVYLEYIAKEIGERKKSREDLQMAHDLNILTKGHALDILGMKRFGDERDDELTTQGPMAEQMMMGAEGQPGEEGDPFGFKTGKAPKKPDPFAEKEDDAGNEKKPNDAKEKKAPNKAQLKAEIMGEMIDVIQMAVADSRNGHARTKTTRRG